MKRRDVALAAAAAGTSLAAYAAVDSAFRSERPACPGRENQHRRCGRGASAS